MNFLVEIVVLVLVGFIARSINTIAGCGYLLILPILFSKYLHYRWFKSKGKTYFLHSIDVELKGGRNQTIDYSAKDKRAEACGY